MFMKKPFADSFLSKLVSRKLLVWAITTYFFSKGLILAEQWIQVSVAYIGVQGFTDIILKLRSSAEKKD